MQLLSMPTMQSKGQICQDANKGFANNAKTQPACLQREETLPAVAVIVHLLRTLTHPVFYDAHASRVHDRR